MKGIVVYQSKWGDCKRIAEAITRGLVETGHEVVLSPVKDVDGPDPAYNFIVVGGPTRAARAYGPIKGFARRKVKKGWAGKPFATFSTGASVHQEKENTQASERLRVILEKNGLKAAAEPFKAGVQDLKGPLAEGEVERAEEFGRKLGASLSAI